MPGEWTDPVERPTLAHWHTGTLALAHQHTGCCLRIRTHQCRVRITTCDDVR